MERYTWYYHDDAEAMFNAAYDNHFIRPGEEQMFREYQEICMADAIEQFPDQPYLQAWVRDVYTWQEFWPQRLQPFPRLRPLAMTYEQFMADSLMRYARQGLSWSPPARQAPSREVRRSEAQSSYTRERPLRDDRRSQAQSSSARGRRLREGRRSQGRSSSAREPPLREGRRRQAESSSGRGRRSREVRRSQAQSSSAATLSLDIQSLNATATGDGSAVEQNHSQAATQTPNDIPESLPTTKVAGSSKDQAAIGNGCSAKQSQNQAATSTGFSAKQSQAQGAQQSQNPNPPPITIQSSGTSAFAASNNGAAEAAPMPLSEMNQVALSLASAPRNVQTVRDRPRWHDWILEHPCSLSPFIVGYGNEVNVRLQREHITGLPMFAVVIKGDTDALKASRTHTVSTWSISAQSIMGIRLRSCAYKPSGTLFWVEPVPEVRVLTEEIVVSLERMHQCLKAWAETNDPGSPLYFDHFFKRWFKSKFS